MRVQDVIISQNARQRAAHLRGREHFIKFRHHRQDVIERIRLPIEPHLGGIVKDVVGLLEDRFVKLLRQVSHDGYITVDDKLANLLVV